MEYVFPIYKNHPRPYSIHFFLFMYGQVLVESELHYHHTRTQEIQSTNYTTAGAQNFMGLALGSGSDSDLKLGLCVCMKDM